MTTEPSSSRPLDRPSPEFDRRMTWYVSSHVALAVGPRGYELFVATQCRYPSHEDACEALGAPGDRTVWLPVPEPLLKLLAERVARCLRDEAAVVRDVTEAWLACSDVTFGLDPGALCPSCEKMEAGKAGQDAEQAFQAFATDAAIRSAQTDQALDAIDAAIDDWSPERKRPEGLP